MVKGEFWDHGERGGGGGARPSNMCHGNSMRRIWQIMEMVLRRKQILSGFLESQLQLFPEALGDFCPWGMKYPNLLLTCPNFVFVSYGLLCSVHGPDQTGHSICSGKVPRVSPAPSLLSKAHTHGLNLRAHMPMQTKYGICGVYCTVKVKDPLSKQ